jgi:hypothetical protein
MCGLRSIVDRMDKDLAFEHPRTMDELLSRSVLLPVCVQH